MVSSDKNSIAVLALGMDDKKLAILRMAFKLQGGGSRYILAADMEGSVPDVAIIDVDGVDGSKLWSDFCRDHPGLPAVLAMLQPTEDLPAPVVGKPLRVESLFPAMQQAMAMPAAQLAARSAQLGAAPAKSNSGEGEVPAKSEQPAVAMEEPPLRPAVTLPANIDRFDADHGLLGALRTLQRQGQPSTISIQGKELLVVLPQEQRAIVMCNDAVLEKVSQHPKVQPAVAPADAAAGTRAGQAWGLAALIWQVALWTSQGRLPAAIDVKSPMRLRHWPNLTRLAPVPESLRMAAFLVRAPVNLSMTAHMLGVQTNSLFNFVSATYSIGILDVGGSGLKLSSVQDKESSLASIAAPAAEGPAQAASAPTGGLLSRLLRKVMRL